VGPLCWAPKRSPNKIRDPVSFVTWCGGVAHCKRDEGVARVVRVGGCAGGIFRQVARQCWRLRHCSGGAGPTSVPPASA
jgi:hypothetical protein